MTFSLSVPPSPTVCNKSVLFLPTCPVAFKYKACGGISSSYLPWNMWEGLGRITSMGNGDLGAGAVEIPWALLTACQSVCLLVLELALDALSCCSCCANPPPKSHVSLYRKAPGQPDSFRRPFSHAFTHKLSNAQIYTALTRPPLAWNWCLYIQYDSISPHTPLSFVRGQPCFSGAVPPQGSVCN